MLESAVAYAGYWKTKIPLTIKDFSMSKKPTDKPTVQKYPPSVKTQSERNDWLAAKFVSGVRQEAAKKATKKKAKK